MLQPFPKQLEGHPVFQEVYLVAWLYESSMIGFKESRDLLQLLIRDFEQVRDKELDEHVVLLEQRENEDKSLDEEPPDLPE